MHEKPKFLFDENIGASVAGHFIAAGYDVLSATLSKDLRGSPDKEILERALEEDRIIVTFDKDFAELVFHLGSSHKGVILLRLHKISSTHVIDVLEKILNEISHIPSGKFLTVSETNVRIR